MKEWQEFSTFFEISLALRAYLHHFHGVYSHRPQLTTNEFVKIFLVIV